MINHPAFDFKIDKANNSITVIREFDADQQSVWDAFTQQEILDQWWAPRPWQSKTKSMNFKEGGRRIYAMVGPQGEEHWAIFDYHSIRQPDYFSGLDGFSDSDGVLNTDLPRMQWEVNFSGKGEKTKVDMLIRFERFEDLEKIIEMGFKEGFAMALNNLDEILETAEKKA